MRLDSNFDEKNLYGAEKQMSACNVWDNDGLCKKTAALFYEFLSMSKKATRRETLTRQEEAELQMFEAKVSRLDSEKAEVMKSFAQSALSPRFVFALLQVLIKREGKSETRGVELPNVDREKISSVELAPICMKPWSE